MSRGNVLVHAVIMEDSWNYGNIPVTTASILWKPEQGFEIEMRCYESLPQAFYKEFDSPVYRDSCMECFLNFYPQEGVKYLNCEVNANGAMLCQVGEQKTGRVFIRDMGMKQPNVSVNRTEEFWEVRYIIPLTLIQAIYGKKEFLKGQIITGNFYKCGDETKAPHFGSWKRIYTEKPDFHQPKYFGVIEIW